MAYDVTLEFFGLDKNELVTYSVAGDLRLDELLVRAAKRCGISPITRNLFAFKQVNFSPQSFRHARSHCVRQGCHSQVIIATERFVILNVKKSFKCFSNYLSLTLIIGTLIAPLQ